MIPKTDPTIDNLHKIAEHLQQARLDYIALQSSTHIVDKNRFISAIARKLFSRDWKPQLVTEKSLKSLESEIGAKIFGVVKPGERREFFNDNQSSWFFHQEITDVSHTSRSVTLHYEVNDNGILRVNTLNGSMECVQVAGQELDNFIQATNIYYSIVMRQLYKIDPVSGKKLQ